MGSRIDKIGQVRKRLKISMEEVAGYIGVSRQKYSRFERGDGALSMDQLDKLFNLFKLKLVKDKPVVLKPIENPNKDRIQKNQADRIIIQNDIIAKLVSDIKKLEKLLNQINKVSNEEKIREGIQSDLSEIQKRISKVRDD